MHLLVALKDYLSDRPETAFLAITLVSLFYLFRKYERAQSDHIETLMKVAPLADQLCRVISKIRKKHNIPESDPNMKTLKDGRP